MANSNYDAQLDRMKYLMGYQSAPIKESKSNIEYHVDAADGKTYGIIKENSMYYIKTTTPDKALVKESYDYINGFNYRNENGYKSYNEATKHLELRLMSINESLGKHEDVSVVLNPKKREEDLTVLTEAARTELNRMHQIFENSNTIGAPVVGKDSVHGSATDPKKQGEPFTDKAEATLDKDVKCDGTVEGATPDNKDVKPDMESDKNKTENSGSDKDYKPAHDDLEGDGVADKDPKGGKAVMVNEGVLEGDSLNIMGDESMAQDMSDPLTSGEDEPVLAPDDMQGNDDNLVGLDSDTEPIVGDENQDINPEEFEAQDDELSPMDELDQLLREFEEITDGDEPDSEAPITEEDKIVGPDKVMDGTQKGTDSKDAEWERINEDETQKAKQGNEDTLKNYQAKGNMPVQSWDKLNESIEKIVENVCAKLQKQEKKKETIKEAIDRIVAEEITRLDIFGKHPKYGKEPMTTPDNKEVLAGTADKDWNDDSAKGSEQYGKKIGSSAPYDKVVDMLTDNVMKQLKESLGLKKK